MPLRRAGSLAAVVGLLTMPAVARAEGEPIMPLDQVHAGMHCTGASVIHGTAISTFDVEVLDVVAGDPAVRQPYILIQVSGPAVDATGLGPGFSGSPIRCADGLGTMRIIGAVSQGIGAYGNKQALATPIQSIIGEPVIPPAGIRTARALVARARPWATPLSVSGLSPAVADMVQRAGARAGRAVYAAPPAPPQTAFPVQQLVPGASMAVGLSSGDVTAGAIGTVSYVDGSSVWGFGHPMDSVGRRSLFLQDAYVYSVVNNPVGSSDLQTYKYAAIGHDVGVLTDDGISGVVGTLGQAPPQFPMKIIARDLDNNDVSVANIAIADETGVGLPTGASSLAQVGPIAVAQMAYEAIDGAPARQSGSMCARFVLAETRRPLRFCNSYVGGGGGEQSVGGGPLVADFSTAAGMLDAYNFGPLHIKSVEVNMQLTRSLRQAYLLSLTAPPQVRRGRSVRVRLTAQRVGGARLSRSITLHIPRDTPPGPRYLTLTGTAGDLSSSAGDTLTLDLSGGSEDDPGAESGPRTVGALRRSIESIHRADGVTFSLREPGASAGSAKERKALRDPGLRYSGQARALVYVS